MCLFADSVSLGFRLNKSGQTSRSQEVSSNSFVGFICNHHLSISISYFSCVSSFWMSDWNPIFLFSFSNWNNRYMDEQLQSKYSFLHCGPYWFLLWCISFWTNLSFILFEYKFCPWIIKFLFWICCNLNMKLVMSLRSILNFYYLWKTVRDRVSWTY